MLSLPAFQANYDSILLEKLSKCSDEISIRDAVRCYLSALGENVADGSQKRGVTAIRKKIKDVFPDRDKSDPQYYFSTAGKGSIPRWEHLALWFLSSNESRLEMIGDQARQEYFNGLQPVHVQGHEQVQVQAHEQVQENLGVIGMVAMDSETKEIVSKALEHSGLRESEFVAIALKTYAKTLIGKEKLHSEDLSVISTEDLLHSGRYKRHPQRADELSRRAVIAIERHNQNQGENATRWHINQTAVQALTGSRAESIKPILDSMRVRIDDHNQKYGLSAYDNRKKDLKLVDCVNMAALVPDGIE